MKYVSAIMAFFCFLSLQAQQSGPEKWTASFDTILLKIQANYVHPVAPEKIKRKGIDAMFAMLDPHSFYMSPPEAEEFRISLHSKLGGTGMRIGLIDSQYIVMAVFEGNPAQRAGISVGDELMQLDDMATKGRNMDDVLSRLRGQPGTKVKIIVKPVGKTITRNVELQREEIKIGSVPYSGMIDKKTGYIRLTGMTEKCSDDVLAALTALQKEPGLEGIILDLRYNTGGLFKEATRIANFFIEKGRVLVSTKGRQGDTVYYATETPVAPALPLVVLTSSMTASSAEILSGALQDNDRAVIIGQATYGKGLVGQIFSMGHGAEAVITTAFYYTPAGRCIQSKNYWEEGNGTSSEKKFTTHNGRIMKAAAGIVPDIELPAKPESPVLACLRDNNYVFKYVTRHINAANVSDADYATFIDGLGKESCVFTTETEKKLNELKETAAKENYLNTVGPMLKQMEEKLQAEKKHLLLTYKPGIKAMLEGEIASRTGYERARIAVELRYDDELKKAVEVLKNTEGIKRILAQK